MLLFCQTQTANPCQVISRVAESVLFCSRNPRRRKEASHRRRNCSLCFHRWQFANRRSPAHNLIQDPTMQNNVLHVLILFQELYLIHSD